MKKIKDTLMMIICALMLAAVFIVFAFFAIFSSTARWMIDQAMHKVGDIISEGEERFIAKHRDNPDT